MSPFLAASAYNLANLVSVFFGCAFILLAVGTLANLAKKTLLRK